MIKIPKSQWKKTQDSKEAITYEHEGRKTVLDVVTPYHSGKNSFVAITISGQGTKTFPNPADKDPNNLRKKFTVTGAKNFAKGYMKAHP